MDRQYWSTAAAAVTLCAAVAFTQTPAASQAPGAEFQTPAYMELAKAIPMAKLTLAQGIQQVVKGGAIANEAKYEMDGGKLMLSVYSSQKGLDVQAEDNAFDEYKGDVTGASWMPKQEVFADLKHIARSAQYHTLLSMTKQTIPSMIQKASTGGATVVSVKEKVRNGKPVFEVVTLQGGAIKPTYYDIVSGEPITA